MGYGGEGAGGGEEGLGILWVVLLGGWRWGEWGRTYLEEEAEGETGGEGGVVYHCHYEGGAAGLRIVGAEAAVEGDW